MFGFWRREQSSSIGQPLVLRCKAHPALLLWQWREGKWILQIDPEAPVEHQELLHTLDLLEDHGLNNNCYPSKQQAAFSIKQACR